MKIETYKGYAIWRNTKSVTKRNRVSGHSWTEQVPLKSFYIAGPGARVSRLFRSVVRARREIDLILSIKNLLPTLQVLDES